MKEYVVYAAGVLIILSLAYAWHEKDKQVDALQVELTAAQATIKLKDEEYERVGKATEDRDEKVEEQNRKLSAIETQLRRLAKSNAAIQALLTTPIPPESLRMLRSYSEHQAKSTEPPTKASNDASIRR